mmetsp:Transcript_28949/g.67194  ORF Transcript_28949/g.67194 Transcript_28949/m.67194 type:complete len:82 (-) Transcript_28949:461-706(-)
MDVLYSAFRCCLFTNEVPDEALHITVVWVGVIFPEQPKKLLAATDSSSSPLLVWKNFDLSSRRLTSREQETQTCSLWDRYC